MPYRPITEKSDILRKLRKYGKIESTDGYISVQIRPLSRFKKGSIKTLDIGEPGGHQLTRGRLIKTDKWATQRVMIEKDSLSEESVEIARKAKLYQ